MSFALDLSKFANLTDDKMELVAKKSAIGLFSDIVKDTPVDSGRLRSNWQPAINKFSDETNEEADKSGNATVLKINAELNTFKLGDTMTMSNNLPYAKRIEFEGWSKVKAPAGMVRINVIRWQKYLDEEARKLR